MVFPDRRLYLLFTPTACAADPWATLEAALRGGVDLVQWRSKQSDPEGLRRCLDACGAARVPVIVNDDVMAAISSRAHGAHVGQDDMPAIPARRLLGERWLGVSTHDLEQLRTAVHDGADYVGFGPCFPTATKGYAQGLPRELIEAACAQRSVPVYAIGGITAQNLIGLRLLGVDRIAVSRAILQAEDPGSAAAALRHMLGG
jgi:thiamine-phosphate pyrophosphorylase